MRVILGGAKDGDDGPREREEDLSVRTILLALAAEEVAGQGSRGGLFDVVGSEFAIRLATCMHHVMPLCNLE